MGGNVFGNTKRLPREEFLKLADEVTSKLSESIFTDDWWRMDLTRSYHSKESFGDMDIIVDSSGLPSDWIERLKREFSLSDSDVSNNGGVVSFRYRDFQIDLITTTPEDYFTSYDYFSWNDLSNLMGRITYKHGLKFSHRGTYVVVKDGSHQIGEVLVTKSTHDLCDYFGWDYWEWESGFSTMEDAYRWLVKTPYFNKDVFALENRNHVAAVRDKKRPNYKNFLIWLETQTDLPEYPYSETNSKGGYYLREPYYGMLCTYWPNVESEVNKLIANYNFHKEFKSKFNGFNVQEVTGLKDLELGKFMKWAKNEFDQNPKYKRWMVDSVSSHEDLQYVIAHLNVWYKNGRSFQPYLFKNGFLEEFAETYHD